jgi:DNA-directed RNA polymerase subunit RPC12/RpoP
MKPSFRKSEDDVVKKVEEKVKSEVDTKIKSEVDKRVGEILKEKDEKDKAQKAERIAKAVDVAKAIKGESDKEKGEKDKGEKDKDESDKIRDDVFCPTCHTGHLHKMEQAGLSVKCVGDKCGKEYILVDKNSDYQCATCGVPIKKPDDPKSIEGCPFCSGRKAFKYDWTKTWKAVKGTK